MRHPSGQALLGDNVDILKTLPEGSCTAATSDPPSGKRLFKGVNRFELVEGAAYCRSLKHTLSECMRVLEPGGFILLWAYPQTSHWVCLALEVAGYDIVARIPWFNAEGKPQSAGLFATGFEEWILARTPGPPRPLHLERWKAACTGGRHPRNVLMGMGFGAAVDELVGKRKSGGAPPTSGATTRTIKPDKRRAAYGSYKGTTTAKPVFASEGGPSRFYPVEETLLAVYGPRARHVHRELFPGGPHTVHPSPKSPGLLVPLVDLVAGCPSTGSAPGHILDPWMGSGGVATAAMALGHDYTGIDCDPQWTAEAQQRIDYWHQHAPRHVHHNDLH